MDSNNPIIKNMADPHELERMFRKDSEAFKRDFEEAWEQNPNSQILSIWYERLYYSETENLEKTSRLKRDFLVMGVLAIMAGTSTRILFHFIEQNTIAPINLIFGIIPFITAFFVYKSGPRKNVIFTIVFLFLISAVYLNMLPLEEKDSIILAYLHFPVFLWVVAGIAFAGDEYSVRGKRLAYLKFNGEFCILYASMAISGMLLSMITMQLFIIIGMDIEDFYFKNIVLFGAAALAVVASYLVSRDLKLAKNIAPYLAKIFSPLVLITLLAYLVTVIWAVKNPFLDRDFLLVFNGILLLVLVVTIFSITESGAKEKRNISDYVNLALILLALIIDGVALSAIVFRLSSYGISPNRLAVLGVNLLIFANLIWIMGSYASFLRNKTGTEAIQDSITKYLPIYGLWAAFVTFVFPLIF
jgi:hypothetical protein